MLPRGTTPTIKFKYRFNPNTIAVAILTLETRRGVIERDLSTATIEDDCLKWVLTQEETLQIPEKDNIKIQCRYKTLDGTAGTSIIYEKTGYEILHDGVI